MIAAIMLVIGGTPAVAAPGPCNPCPPDCAMMMQAAGMADQHAKGPQQQTQGDNPCKSSIACQTAAALPVLPEGVTLEWAVRQSVAHAIRADMSVPSRPPDRDLRPPIHI
jgi:hypothetical protein